MDGADDGWQPVGALRALDGDHRWRTTAADSGVTSVGQAGSLSHWCHRHFSHMAYGGESEPERHQQVEESPGKHGRAYANDFGKRASGQRAQGNRPLEE